MWNLKQVQLGADECFKGSNLLRAQRSAHGSFTNLLVSSGDVSKMMYSYSHYEQHQLLMLKVHSLQNSRKQNYKAGMGTRPSPPETVTLASSAETETGRL